MSSILQVKIASKDQKMAYVASNEIREEIKIDYNKPYGNGEGYTSLELFLISLGSCLMATTGALLRKEGKVITDIRGRAKGIRYKQHPLSFKEIQLDLEYTGQVTRADVEHVILLAEIKMCPVWAMVSEKVTLKVNFEIHT